MLIDTLGRARFLFLIFCSALGGCVAVDHQSGRAVRYNIEAENAQQQALLLNIIRAYLRRPMQFTTLTNLDGDLSAKASASWGIPFGPYVGGNANVLTINAPDYTENAGVKVVTLDDSSYYKGLLSPVPPQLIDLYFHSGYPPELLVNLFVREIVVQRIDESCLPANHIKGCEFTFTNIPGDSHKIDMFQRVVSYLLRLGLTTEHIDKPEAEKAKSKKKKKDDDDTTDDDTENDYGLCFRPDNPHDQGLVRHSLCAGALQPLQKPGRAKIGKTSTVVVRLENRLIADLKRFTGQEHNGLANELDQFAGREVALIVYARSIQNIIYYLGELVRRENVGEFEPKRTIQVLAVPRHPSEHAWDRDAHRCDHEPPRYPCKYLFRVAPGLGPPALSTWYEGTPYTIVDDSFGASSQVFDLAKQLFAIKIKADKLPRTTTISVNR